MSPLFELNFFCKFQVNRLKIVKASLLAGSNNVRQHILHQHLGRRNIRMIRNKNFAPYTELKEHKEICGLGFYSALRELRFSNEVQQVVVLAR